MRRLLALLVLLAAAPSWAAISTPTNHTSGGFTGAAHGSDTTASFTPTAGTLLFAFIGSRGTVQCTVTISNTHSGSWTWIERERWDAAAVSTAFYYAIVPATPGAGTITFTYSTDQSRTSWIIAEVASGFDTGAPITQTQDGTIASTDLTITMSTLAADSMTLGAVAARGATAVTPGTNETELDEDTSGGTSAIRTQMQYGTAGDESVNWLTDAINSVTGIAFEIKVAAAGGASTVPAKMHQYRQRRTD